MDIPYQSLSADTLDAILEEYASREGTEYGEHEYTLAQKISQLREQLKKGEIGLTFDPNTESCTLVALK